MIRFLQINLGPVRQSQDLLQENAWRGSRIFLISELYGKPDNGSGFHDFINRGTVGNSGIHIWSSVELTG